jgi:hypothetical protein
MVARGIGGSNVTIEEPELFMHKATQRAVVKRAGNAVATLEYVADELLQEMKKQNVLHDPYSDDDSVTVTLSSGR